MAKCNQYEYESTLTPNAVKQIGNENIVMVVDSLDSISDPQPNFIYIVDGESYIYVDGEFILFGSECYSIDDLADGSEPSGDITITVTTVHANAFRDKNNISGLSLPNAVEVKDNAFNAQTNMQSFSAPNLQVIGAAAFPWFRVSFINLPSVTSIGSGAFTNCSNSNELLLGLNIDTIGENAFRNFASDGNVNSMRVRILGTPTSMGTNIFNTTKQGDIYVPWADGAVANAPWGATGATIHYNTVFDEDGNVISSD